MANSIKNKSQDVQKAEFKWFAAKRIIVGILIASVFLWVIVIVLGFFEKPSEIKVARKHEMTSTKSLPKDKIKKNVRHEEQTKEGAVKTDEGVHLAQKETGGVVPHERSTLQIFYQLRAQA